MPSSKPISSPASAAFLRARARIVGSASSPLTVTPRRARAAATASVPVPHPTSSIRSPSAIAARSSTRRLIVLSRAVAATTESKSGVSRWNRRAGMKSPSDTAPPLGATARGRAAALAAPALAALVDRDDRDEQRHRRVEPPEPQQRIAAQPNEQADREIRAEHVLPALALRGRRAQRLADPRFRDRERRHRRRGEGGESDPQPAHDGVVAADEGPCGLDGDVRGQYVEREGDQLLSAPLRDSRATARARE